MARKIYEVAKELGVKSKQVIDRCEAEGIPNIKSHMSVISAGLEETIRGWFAGAEDDAEETSSASASTATATATSVAKPAPPKTRTRAVAKKKKKVTPKEQEETQQSAIDKALKETRKVAKKSAPDETESSDAVIRRTLQEAGVLEEHERREAEAAAAKAQLEALEAEQAAAAAAQTEAASDAPIAPTEGEPLAPAAAESMAPEANAPSTPKTPDRPSVSAVPNVPQRPDAVTPAGPKLSDVQKPARLSGPKVVRIEQAERVEQPRRAPRTDFGGGGGRGAVPGEAGGGEGGDSRRNTRRRTRGGRDGRSAAAGGGGERQRGQPRNWGQQDLIEREERLRGSHGFIKTIRRGASKPGGGGHKAKTAVQTGGVVKISEPFSMKDLSAATGVPVANIVRAMMKKGIMTANPNAGIPTDLAMELMLEYEIELEVTEKKTAEESLEAEFKKRESTNEVSRAPVVTILGHVDHGKTSLLDAIRDARVAEGEAGGITQHTSAFRVSVRAGDESKNIVFLDTPGHEAFTAMRARGAQITDIVILVVAADDGVMPQTVESINHAKAAGVPIIIALNKIDKPEATDTNIQRIYGQLAEHELSPTEWGGSTELVKISALKQTGIQELLDTIDLQAQVMELTADDEGSGRGTVIEARMVDGRGPVANLLVQDGRIKVGDFVVIGRAFGRVRDLRDDRGKTLTEAGPSSPIELSGLSAVPDAGDHCYIVESLKRAEHVATQRVEAERERALAAPKVTLDNIFTQIEGGERKQLNLVVKADVQGSVETLKKTLEEIASSEVVTRVLHSGVGGISEADVRLAEASGAIILGFHVIASARARDLAEQKNVEIRPYQVIYELLDDVRKAASGLLEPELREEVLGHATVREVFKISKVGMIAGCYVTDGSIERNAKIRVTRQDIVVENNRTLEQLKRFKDDAKEVKSGQECGMKIEGYDDIKVDDVLECYRVTKITRSL